MASGKQIFYVMSCNEWEEYSSCRLDFLSTNANKVRDYLCSKVENGDMEYFDSELSPKEQRNALYNDWKNKTRLEINSNLKYGFYDYAYDGEEM